MKLWSIAGLSGYGVPTITGIAYSATALPSGPTVGLSFTNYEGLKEFRGGVCVNTLLNPQVRDKFLNRQNIPSDKWQNIKDKFKGPIGNGLGCVSVLWEKTTWSDGNWKGTVRYEWLYTINVDIVVTYGLFNTDDDDPKIRWRTIYVNTNTWEIGWKLWDTDKSKLPRFSLKGSDGQMFDLDSEKVCPKYSCYGAHNGKTWGESKWAWKERTYGDQKFTAWTSNFTEVFSPITDDLVKPDWTKLTERDGIWFPL